MQVIKEFVIDVIMVLIINFFKQKIEELLMDVKQVIRELIQVITKGIIEVVIEVIIKVFTKVIIIFIIMELYKLIQVIKINMKAIMILLILIRVFHLFTINFHQINLHLKQSHILYFELFINCFINEHYIIKQIFMIIQNFNEFIHLNNRNLHQITSLNKYLLRKML